MTACEYKEKEFHGELFFKLSDAHDWKLLPSSALYARLLSARIECKVLENDILRISAELEEEREKTASPVAL